MQFSTVTSRARRENAQPVIPARFLLTHGLGPRRQPVLRIHAKCLRDGAVSPRTVVGLPVSPIFCRPSLVLFSPSEYSLLTSPRPSCFGWDLLPRPGWLPQRPPGHQAASVIWVLVACNFLRAAETEYLSLSAESTL